MRTYQNTQSWTKYRSILKNDFGIVQGDPSRERWRKIRGHKIHLDEWDSEGPTRGTLILVHGAGGNGRILAPFGESAAKFGWRVLAPDLPGYGLTQPSEQFQWDYEEWFTVIAELAESCDGPVVLMGLSLGGMTAVLAAQASKKVSGVIATTLLDLGDPITFVRSARWNWLGVVTLLGIRFIPWIIDRASMPLWLIAPMTKMSGNDSMRRYFNKDRLLGRLWVSSRFFRTIHAQKLTRFHLHCPLLLIHPGADDWTPTELSLAAFEVIEGSKRVFEMTNGSHLPLEQPAFSELQIEVVGFLSELER
jgi:pimeloyl-ACP methyl ester carboxylesterase